MSDCNTLQPTAKIRWLRVPSIVFGMSPTPVLQQWWTDPLDRSGTGEWRDVPDEIGNSKPVSHPVDVEL